MKVLWLSLFVFFLITFCSSCKPKPDYSNEISQLDSILNYWPMRGTPANEFHHLDTETINITIRLQGNKLDSISNRLKSDTLNPGMAIFLSISYENLRKMRNFSKERDLFLTEIQKQKNVLDNLRHDLKENLVPENKGHEYCVKEITKYRNIEFKGYELWRGMTEAERKIDSLKDKIAVTNDSLYTE